jgi:hypothetical protein
MDMPCLANVGKHHQPKKDKSKHADANGIRVTAYVSPEDNFTKFA